MISLLTALIFAPNALQSGPVLGPVIPAGCSPNFQSIVAEVEAALQAKQWAKASTTLARLPKISPVMLWDDAKVPVRLREAFQAERDRAVTTWRGHIMPKFVTSGNADIKVSFEPVLAVASDTGLPLGSAIFRHATVPAFESVIGLKRGRPLTPISLADVHNEVAYALAIYGGLASTPTFGTVSGRSDLSAAVRTVAVGPELGLMDKLQGVVGELKNAVAKKISLTPAVPNVQIQPRAVSGGTVMQGDVATLTIQIANRGNAPLSYRFQPECGCVLPPIPGEIAPGAIALVHPRFDTTEYYRPLSKRIFVITNDPDQPVIAVPLSVDVVPRYRLISPLGPKVVVPAGGTDVEIYLCLPKGSKMEVKDLQFDGIPGTAVYESWDGELADPDLQQGKMPRHGYHFTVSLGDALPPGRASGTLVIRTNDKVFPNLRYNLYAQKGMIALPDELFWGDLTQEAKHSSFLVTQPGHPFKLTGAISDSPYLRVTLPTVGTDEQRVTVDYDGKAPTGDFRAVIRVSTDDPKQPEIVVRVRATVP